MGRRAAWTAAAKDRFFEILGEACNIRVAARAADIDSSAIYKHKLSDPEFAARWRLALAMGYDRIEERLIRDACGDPEARMDKCEREQALNLLKYHRDEVGSAHRGGPALTRSTPEETDAAILKALAAVKKRMDREAK